MKLLGDLLTILFSLGVGVSTWYLLLPVTFWERLMALTASASGILFVLVCFSLVRKAQTLPTDKH